MSLDSHVGVITGARIRCPPWNGGGPEVLVGGWGGEGIIDILLEDADVEARRGPWTGQPPVSSGRTRRPWMNRCPSNSQSIAAKVPRMASLSTAVDPM